MRKLIQIVIGVILMVKLFQTPNPALAQTALFASPTGTGTDCTTSKPCNLQYAVEVKATTGDSVYVHSGTYTADHPSDQQVIYINKNIHLYGRCQWPGGVHSCGLHNPESILDGENARRVIKVEGTPTNPVNITLRYFRIIDGNAYNLTTTDCTTTYGAAVSGCGGGIFAHHIDYFGCHSSIFWGNNAANNISGSGVSLGGGIYLVDAGPVSIGDNIFTNNTAALSWSGVGGAIYAEDIAGYLDMDQNQFYGNSASYGSSAGSYGVSIALHHAYGGITVKDNFFESNGVAGIAVRGAAIFADLPGSIQILNNLIISNTANSMIEVHDDNGSPNIYIERNYIWGNQSAWANIWLENQFNTYIINNIVGVLEPVRNPQGGATYNIYLYDSDGASQSIANIWHNTLASADAGIMSAGYVTAWVENNIISHQDFVGIGFEPWSPNAIFHIGINLFFANNDNGLTGSNPIYGNPLYREITLGDLHINPGSAAENQGPDVTTVTMDYEGDPRPIGPGPTPYDLGADEIVFWQFLPAILH